MPTVEDFIVISDYDVYTRNEVIDDEIDTEDLNIIDVEEDFSAPIFVHHTEATLDEIDKMDEDVYEEPVLDIDNADKGNPLAVVEYIDEIFAHYRKQEVHYKFELMEETLYLTVNLIDRFLERQTLVGVTTMLLACKYEEISVPVVEDFIVISENAYTITEVLDMEKVMVNTLQFNLSVPTPYVFTKRFLKAAQSQKEVCFFYLSIFFRILILC
uniref:Cyclin-like domain-containing protein n=1 Tax=Lactuca sativa TaxID=4236 RepID=A0A9R1WDP8_LACSA|nr:hypothetical protein LSAT_V11C200052330 [Lactuca sativa]